MSADRTAPVACIVVTYHADEAVVRRLAEVLERSGLVIVVDNTEGEGPRSFPASAIVLRRGVNLGIAGAFNWGIQEARQRGARRVVLFDQDSVVDAAFVPTLIAGLKDDAPGVAAPVAWNRRLDIEYPSHRLSPWVGWRPAFAAGAANRVPVDVVISSGCAATMATYDVVGLLDESLFIDSVDVDWCLRCRHHGIPLWVEPGARLDHAIGDSDIKLTSARASTVHGPARTYYKMRNPWLLSRRAWCPAALGFRLVASALLHGLIVGVLRPSRARWQSLLLGLVHGVAGRAGVRGAR